MVASVTVAEERFGFGRNWKDYIDKHFSQQRVDIARAHLLQFLGVTTLSGKSFLDIGCGSGIHSLAAHQAGAKQIFSFDFDPLSVETTRFLRRHAGDPDTWQVRQGSVLDHQFVAAAPTADIVYSWGVLHHTGDMWTALRNTVELIQPGGVFYVALYSANVQKKPPPEFWLDVKRRYNAASELGKRRMELWYIWRFDIRHPLRLPIVLAKAAAYKKSRGMSYYSDIKDWLGGWPMEFALDEDVTDFAKVRGLSLINIKTGEANTEFLFAKAGQP